MATRESTKHIVKSKRIGTKEREGIKRELLEGILGEFDNAWAVIETGWRVLEDVGEAGACHTTIGVGLEMYRKAYNSLDVTILGMRLDGED